MRKYVISSGLNTPVNLDSLVRTAWKWIDLVSTPIVMSWTSASFSCTLFIYEDDFIKLKFHGKKLWVLSLWCAKYISLFWFALCSATSHFGNFVQLYTTFRIRLSHDADCPALKSDSYGHIVNIPICIFAICDRAFSTKICSVLNARFEEVWKMY